MASLIDLTLQTWRALMAPRRAVPIAVVSAPMVAAQYAFSQDLPATLLGLGMCVFFVTVSPLAWRVFFPRGGRRGTLSRLWRLGAYSLVGALPAVGGFFVPRWFGLGSTFLTGGVNMLVVAALFWAGGWGLGRDIDLEEGLEAQLRRAERLSREAEQARLLALRAQLDPHFLFNTLNAIAEWVRDDPVVAEEAILRLSAMLRTVLEGVGPDAWPLEREVALALDLFELHRIRDPAAFFVTTDLPPGLGEVMVPPLILLPLAENAMTHGPRAGHRGEVGLSVSAGERVRVAITNPGAFAGRRDGGSGLPTVERRLALAYEGAANLRITAEGERTLCVIEVPAGGPGVGV